MIRRVGRKVAKKSVDIFAQPLKKIYKQHRLTIEKNSYNNWALENERQCFLGPDSKKGPLVSVVVPAFNPVPQHFSEMVYSVVNQHYQNWEMIIVNASSDQVSRQQIDQAGRIDSRIKVIDVKKNLGIAGNTNIGIDHCQGDYIAFFDHDDLLHACALHCLVRAVMHDGAELAYSDEDKIKADDSMFFEPLCKPGWSPHLFRNANYINHLTIVKSDFVRKVNGLRPETDGAQDYDLLLRIIDTCRPKIVHVPRVLYHWRAAPSSTAANFSTKLHVLKAGVHAVQQHLDRNSIAGLAKSIDGRPGWYEIEYAAPARTTIVVGPTAPDKRRMCAVWLQELVATAKAGLPAVELVVGDWFDGFRSDDVFNDVDVHLVSSDAKHYWQDAAEFTHGQAVLCFSAASSPVNSSAVAQLVSCAYQLNAIVAPVLISGGKYILDAGLIETNVGLEPLFLESRLGDWTAFGSTEWVRNVSGLTMQVFAATTTTFRHVAQAVAKHQPLDVISPDMLRDGQVDLVSSAHCQFLYKGPLTNLPLTNHSFGNPELAQISPPSIRVKMSSWGTIGERSERENV